jgi:hypothetical protein
MSTLSEVGERDAWRCWLCDEPVDPDASVNADRGPSVDSGASPKGKKAAAATERPAHRACNTRKGAVKPVVAWSPELLVVEPAPIVATVDRLTRKGGRCADGLLRAATAPVSGQMQVLRLPASGLFAATLRPPDRRGGPGGLFGLSLPPE